MNSAILGTGSYVPKRVLTNADLERMVETSDSWIVERTGIRERRVVKGGQACSDLAVEAAQRALVAAKVRASDIDLILSGDLYGRHPASIHCLSSSTQIRRHTSCSLRYLSGLLWVCICLIRCRCLCEKWNAVCAGRRLRSHVSHH